eukprot:TRINITY_DN164_c0_g1_i3.p1 TRINITY_DN164_c0_g1~~TRINITY_DN164_c0_g1_i3.p1  ORF type:complete len:668 (-),score=149.03 TRINITY_DN164_c0_g1_i3:127-2130(-)
MKAIFLLALIAATFVAGAPFQDGSFEEPGIWTESSVLEFKLICCDEECGSNQATDGRCWAYLGGGSEEDVAETSIVQQNFTIPSNAVFLAFQVATVWPSGATQMYFTVTIDGQEKFRINATNNAAYDYRYQWVYIPLYNTPVANGQVHRVAFTHYNPTGDRYDTHMDNVKLLLTADFPLTDPSFEEEELGAWVSEPVEAATVCCGTDCGPENAYDGVCYAWLGGNTDQAEEANFSQTFYFPVGSATIEFYMYLDWSNPSNGDAYFGVFIDNNLQQKIDAAQYSSYMTYAKVTVNVTAFADGELHNLQFVHSNPDGAGTFSTFIDLVSIHAASASTGAITSGAVTSGQITTKPITSGLITTKSITSGQITTGASITSGLITSGAITSGALTTGEITTGEPETSEVSTGETTTGGPGDDRFDITVRFDVDLNDFNTSSVVPAICSFVAETGVENCGDDDVDIKKVWEGSTYVQFELVNDLADLRNDFYNAISSDPSTFAAFIGYPILSVAWAPISTASTGLGSTDSVDDGDSSSGGLSRDSVILIAVLVPVGAICLIAIIVVLARRNRRRGDNDRGFNVEMATSKATATRKIEADSDSDSSSGSDSDDSSDDDSSETSSSRSRSDSASTATSASSKSSKSSRTSRSSSSSSDSSSGSETSSSASSRSSK